MYLSIDPSINNVGVTLYNPTTEEFNWILIKPPKKDLPSKLRYIERHLKEFIYERIAEFRSSVSNPLLLVTELVCEYPQFFASQKGAVAATMGYTLDLACICGYIAGICKLANINFKTPIQWKGQLTKQAIEKRFIRRFPGIPLPSEHEQEACMMMLYFLESK